MAAPRTLRPSTSSSARTRPSIPPPPQPKMTLLGRVGSAAEILSLADAHGVDTSPAGLELLDTDYDSIAYRCLHFRPPTRCQLRMVARMVTDEAVEGAMAEDGGFYDVFLRGEHRHPDRLRAEDQAPAVKKRRGMPDGREVEYSGGNS